MSSSSLTQRWTIRGTHRIRNPKDPRFYYYEFSRIEPALAMEEVIEVMPVSEHLAAMAEMAAANVDLAHRLGQAQGELESSKWPGVIRGWRDRAEQAEAKCEEIMRENRKPAEQSFLDAALVEVLDFFPDPENPGTIREAEAIVDRVVACLRVSGLLVNSKGAPRTSKNLEVDDV